MPIRVSRDRIIVGAATRLDIITPEKTISLGSTTGDTITRRELEYTDIMNNIGLVVAKIPSTDKFFIETSLAESTIEMLSEIWNKADEEEETIDDFPVRTVTLTKHQRAEPVREMIIEGPGAVIEQRTEPIVPVTLAHINSVAANPEYHTDKDRQRIAELRRFVADPATHQEVPIKPFVSIRQYNFPNVVTMSATSQILGKSSMTIIPVTFEVIADTRQETNTSPSLTDPSEDYFPQQAHTNTTNFGTIKHIGTEEMETQYQIEPIP